MPGSLVGLYNHKRYNSFFWGKKSEQISWSTRTWKSTFVQYTFNFIKLRRRHDHDPSNNHHHRRDYQDPGILSVYQDT